MKPIVLVAALAIGIGTAVLVLRAGRRGESGSATRAPLTRDDTLVDPVHSTSLRNEEVRQLPNEGSFEKNQVTLQADDDVSTLRRRLLDTISWTEARTIVNRLKQIGTFDAIKAILDFATDSEPHFPPKADLLADVLSDVQHPGIADVMTTALAAYIAQGNDSWVAGGFARLIASKGTPRQVTELLNLAGSKDIGMQLRIRVAESLALVNEESMRSAIRDLMRDLYARGEAGIAGAIAKSVSSYGVNDRADVLAIARSSELPAECRLTAYSAWGSGLTAEDAGIIGIEYDALSVDQKGLALSALSALLEMQSQEGRSVVLKSAAPMLSDALLYGVEDAYLNALSTANGNAEYLPIEFADVLREAAARAPSEKYARRATACADKISAALR